MTRAAVPDVLPETAPRGRLRPVATPEGIELPFVLATAGQRFSAFLIDFTVVAGGLLLLLGAFLLAGEPEGGWFPAFLMLAAFLLWNFYFTVFELRGGGATPGKRRIGLRVMDARGGRLEASAIVTRNLMRSLELYVPVVFLVAPLGSDDLPGWVRVAAGLWVVAFLVLPLLNRDRLRAGDLAAGTVVVVAPRALLLPDLASAPPEKPGATRLAFTDAQLAVYGVFELQVLEEVLRRPAGGLETAEAVDAVAQRIARKIRYPSVPRGRAAREFLLEFYAALRSRLEHRMLFGRRKRDKHAREE